MRDEHENECMRGSSQEVAVGERWYEEALLWKQAGISSKQYMLLSQDDEPLEKGPPLRP